MPGLITPLPVMLEEEDRKIYEKLEPPKSLVCRYGYQKMIAELDYDGQAKPGCGSKLVIRTRRGIEMAEMLTSTCPNAGCSKSVTRKQMLQYIDNSGGKDFPFTGQGKVLRLATVEDLNDQSQLDSHKPQMIQFTKSLIRELDLPMRLIELERLLGGERVIFYYTSEQWVDFRELVRKLASEYQTRIEMQQVNAREEARLVADYERCGQYCCCKNFLKILKPVSMRSAKIQKATLDPTKISGRCGRLMCCLRYEDQTYETLRKRLPRRQSRVATDDGLGTVVDTQILTQLALVKLDNEVKTAAYAVENIRVLDKEQEAQWVQDNPSPPAERQTRPQRPPAARKEAPAERAAEPKPAEQTEPKPADANAGNQEAKASANGQSQPPERSGKRRRRRRRRKGKDHS